MFEKIKPPEGLIEDLRYLNSNIFNIGFRLCRSKYFKSAPDVRVSDDACQCSGHDVVISIGGTFFVERFVCCMTHEEKLSIQQ